jgi:hypothetical protein
MRIPKDSASRWNQLVERGEKVDDGTITEAHLKDWDTIKQRLAELDALYQPLLILNPF